MKLKRLRIEQLRQFRQPLEIRDFGPGINLFTGPNGAGKSSIVRAIRAAFFERYRSSSVDDLRPDGDASASPSIELDFEINGSDCRLSKTFFQRKRCTLQIGGTQLDGEEAEQKLADLLGFQFPGKGASQDKHWGIPGLLWIEQGSGHEINASVGHAIDHLRSALNQSLGEVASSGGDELLEQVRALRAELLTNPGKPRGPYAEVIEEKAVLADALREIDARIATYQQQVDTLARLRLDHATDAAERPWDELLEQQRDIAAQLEKIHQRDVQLAAETSRLKQCRDNLALLQDQLSAFDKDDKQLQQRELALAETQRRLQQTKATEQLLAPRRAAAESAYELARESVRIARQEDQRRSLQMQLESAQSRMAALTTTLTQVEQAQKTLAELRKRVQHAVVEKRDLTTLRAQSSELRELDIQREAVATRVRFAIEPGQQLLLNQQLLSGDGEQLLIASAELMIPGVGRVEIIPGGRDVADLARRQSELAEAHAALLQLLGMVSLDAAEIRFAELEQLRAEIREAEQSLAHHAPNGAAVLLSERETLNESLAAVQARLAELPAAVEALALTDAEQRRDEARETLDTITQETNELLQQLSAQQAACENVQQECDRLKNALHDPARQQRQLQINQQLLDLKAERDGLELRVAEHQRAIDEARPQLLEQDIQRLKNSAQLLEQQFNKRQLEITHLQGQLQQAGSQGLEESRAELAVNAERAERRHNELRRRAQALDLLVKLLDEKRQQLTRLLQAPLQKHLNHYLQLLFPHASVEIDENLTIGQIIRPLQQGEARATLEQQSFGTREQLGLIGRLAYAELLKEAGRPTLIILDDALVHSDEQRLGQMKRILFDAAQRHQILLFSCHPAAWRDLGVAQRSIESLRQA